MSLSFVNETPVPAALAGAGLPSATPSRADLPASRTGRQRRAEPVTDRVRRDGKFFRLGSEKFYVKGVTYGPFAPNSEGLHLPERHHVRRDFEQLVQLGANCV